MSGVVISGIQQIGIGIPDVNESFKWYRQNFGMDIRVFEEAAEAGLMLPYTGGEPQTRHAILAVNLQGGGGFEIWQYTGRKPQPPSFDVQLGDLGIYCAKMKARDVQLAYQTLKESGVAVAGNVVKDPKGDDHFYLQDPYGNLFQIVGGTGWFKETGSVTGGPAGAVLGVSDIERSKHFYADILGYDQVIFEEEGKFEDLQGLPGGKGTFKRALLAHSKSRKGAFSRIFGPSHIELVQALERTGKKIYENRFWGDLGFIHLCFDIQGMKVMQQLCESKGHPFTVDSSESFDVGEAAGHFSYIEDPDGTLIEFVETHKVPILKGLGWYMNLRNRDPEKPLPDWMIGAMRFNRVKD